MTKSTDFAVPNEEGTAGATPSLAKTMQQHLLLAERLSRKDVLSYKASWPLRQTRGHVVRNMPAENIAAASRSFLAHAGLSATWTYSAYDDSLGLRDFDPAAEFVLVWLDFGRYALEGADWGEFLKHKLRVIRSRTPAPVLVADCPSDVRDAQAVQAALDEAQSSIPGLTLYPRSVVASRLGPNYRDARLAKVAGSDLSGPATLEHARDIGLSWIPSLLRPSVKCLALDLDNTLYAGVLGEDGPRGVVLTPAHAALQERLLALQSQGFLLAVVSKNEADDVQELFRLRTDFPIRPELVSAWAVSWNGKASGLTEIACKLNIGADALLFVDDNLGEIASVSAAHPNTAVLLASDPAEVLRGLSLMPGLRRLRIEREDTLRAGDLAARAERERLVGAAGDYVAALKPRLTYRFADDRSLGRLHELSNKTNQFNLALARLTAAEAAKLADGQDSGALGCALSDALSDSGVVLSMFGRAEGSSLIVEDLCISCRALGRNIEDKIILEGAIRLAEKLGCGEIAFRFRRGPRNGPALDWLEEIAERPLKDEEGLVAISLSSARDKIGGANVQTLWDQG